MMSGGIKRRSLLAAIGTAGVGIAGPDVARAAGLPSRIRIATANEVPYGYLDANGHAAGIAPETAIHVLNAIGIKQISWVVTPFGSLIPGLLARRFDMAAAAQNILPRRCDVVAFSVPNASYGEGLLVKRGNPDNIHSYEDIKKNAKLKLAIVSGADELGFAQSVGIPQSQIVTINANDDAPAAVETGRADAYAATELTVASLAERSQTVVQAKPFTNPVVNGKPVRSYGGFSFRKSDTALHVAFDRELAAFKNTDAWAKLMTGFGMSAEDIAASRAASTAALCKAKT